MTNRKTEALTGRELRWLADNYEQAQRARVAVGEQYRAVLQGRDETFVIVEAIPVWSEDPKVAKVEVEKYLSKVARGEITGPVPILGRSYARYWYEERETYKLMLQGLDLNPVWPAWLSTVKGVGPTLACKILGRLDIREAKHISSFWKYSGLATVPAVLYRCPTCKLERAYPPKYKVTGKHETHGTKRQCKDLMVAVAGPEDDIRCAQPRGEHGKPRDYDAYMKKTMYLIGMSFVKCGSGPYEECYRRERAKIQVEKGHCWAKGKLHYWALRKTQKMFLADLWCEWRKLEGLPISEPYAVAHLGHDKVSREQ